MATFWQSIKTGLENGNIAKWTKATGQTAFAVGMTGAMINQMSKSNNCCHHNQYSVFGNNCFGGGYMPFGSYNLFGCGGNNWFTPRNPSVNPGMLGILNNYQTQMDVMNTQYANQLGFNWGYGLGLQAKQASQLQQWSMFPQLQTTPQQQVLQKTDNEYAGDVKEQSTEQGQAFDSAAKEMVTKDGKAVSGKSFEIIKGGLKKDKTEGAEEYRNAVSELGKSYLAEIDGSSGNKDGKVTSDEFIQHSMKDLPSDADATKKAKAKQMALNAFNKIDQNGDGYADWKELAATMATFDSNGQKIDGVITSKEFEQSSDALGTAGNTTFEKLLRKNYNSLFGKTDK